MQTSRSVKYVKCQRLKTPYLVNLVNGKKGKVIFAIKSPYQLIEMILIPSGVGKKKYLRGLFLDGEVQYVEGRNKDSYHYAHLKILKHLPRRQIKRIAILGGGDGILAGLLAKYLPHAKIYVFEIDPCMIYMFKKYYPHDNYYAFHKRNVKPIIGDAFESLEKFEGFDIIFVDLPDALNRERLENLYSPEKLTKVFKKARWVSIYNGGVSPIAIDQIARVNNFRLVGRALAHGWLGAIGFVSHFSKI